MATRFTIEGVFKMTDRFTRPVAQLQDKFQKATRAMTRSISRVNKGLRNMIKSVGRVTAGVAKWSAATAAVGGGTVLLLNQATVQADSLANAVGANVDTMQALGATIAPLGFGFENIIDLVEEMNNKLGESAGLEEILPVTESLAILGLQFEKIKKLKPEDQFTEILNAAIKLEDVQKASSATDILFGGEASRIIGALNRQGKSVEEITEKYRKLNFQTAQGRQQARRFTSVVADLTFAFRSVLQEGAALVGAALAPMLEQLRKWVMRNRELLQQKVVEFVEALVKQVKQFVKWVSSDASKKWADRLILTAKVVVGLTVALQALTTVLTLVNILMWANPVALIVAGVTLAIAAFTGLVIWIDEVIERFDRLPVLIRLAFAPLRLLLVAISEIKDLVMPLFSGEKEIQVGQSAGSPGRPPGRTAPADVRRNTTGVISPQERVTRLFEETQSLNRAEVTIRDESGKAEPTKGFDLDGFNFLPSGGFSR